MKDIQISQNKAVGAVTKHGKSTPVQQLLLECGWRSVRQEVFYHTALQIHKILQDKAPQYLYSRLTSEGDFPYDTRLARSSNIRSGPTFKTSLDLCKKSFRWRGSNIYDSLPSSIKSEEKLTSFKKKLSDWVKENVKI